MAKIFYVEDDPNLSYVIKDCLQIDGHEVSHFSKGIEALECFKKFQYDICILDVMLPDIDGFSITKTIRHKNPHIPIIFVSARTNIQDKLEGLQIGGDDYLFKPFSIEELLLKVSIFIKRSKPNVLNIVDEAVVYDIGSYSFDTANLHLNHPTGMQRLTGREAELLILLYKNKNKIIPRRDILMALWGKDDYFLGRSLDVFICRLRKFLSEDDTIKIENVARVGFKFIAE